MRGLTLLSPRERTIFFVVIGVLMVLFIDLAFRAWGAALARVAREEQRLKKQWDYASGLLARSRSIDVRYNEIRSRYPGLFDGIADRTRIMAELDEAARAAGVQVSMLRPQPSYERAERDDGGVPAPVRPAATVSRIEITLRGSWPQVMRFFQATEGQEHMFQFSAVSVHRQERTGELEVSAVGQK